MEIIAAFFGTLLNSFFIQIYIGALLFAGKYRKKRNRKEIIGLFVLFLVMSIGLMYYVFFINTFWAVEYIYYILCVLFSYLLVSFSYEEPWEEILLGIVSGYLVQHIASQINQIFMIDKEEVITGRAGGKILFFSIQQACIVAAIYIFIYYIFARKTKPLPESPKVKKSMILLSLVTFLVVLVLSGVRDQYAMENFALNIITRIYSIFCCIFIFVLRYNIIQIQERSMENRLLMQMNEMQLRQYKLSQETIELINLKCHDMRHQISVWEKRGSSDKEELQELENLISIYDTSVKTGNDVLDTILTEKSIFCEYNKIHFSCIMDGQWLSFMKERDICILFGNALENAIEAVVKIENPDNRMISMRLIRRHNLLIFTCENYYNGEIQLTNGALKTTKEEENFHGFGIRSIRRVATLYGGEATIELDELFHLSVIIPLPKTI
ncbi:MAG: ATP-binding protein [Lachnospiraceae bacterium]|nr:ATP-binding protein [Lachnospiraceae bacterium]